MTGARSAIGNSWTDIEQFNQNIATELFWHLKAGTGALSSSFSIYYFPVSLYLLTGLPSPPTSHPPPPRARTHWGMSQRTHTKWGPAHARLPSSSRPASVLNVPQLASIPPYPRLGPPYAHHETRGGRGVERDCIPDARGAAVAAGRTTSSADRQLRLPGRRCPQLRLPGPPHRLPWPPHRLPGPPLSLPGPPHRLPGPPLRLPGPPLRLPGPPLRLPGPPLRHPGRSGGA